MASHPETPTAYLGVPPGGAPRGGAIAPPLGNQHSAADSEDPGAPRRGVAQLAATGFVNSYEGLDDEDWDETPFVPPSLPMAIELADEDVFGGKQLNACCTDIDTMS